MASLMPYVSKGICQRSLIVKTLDFPYGRPHPGCRAKDTRDSAHAPLGAGTFRRQKGARKILRQAHNWSSSANIIGEYCYKHDSYFTELHVIDAAVGFVNRDIIASVYASISQKIRPLTATGYGHYHNARRKYFLYPGKNIPVVVNTAFR